MLRVYFHVRRFFYLFASFHLRINISRDFKDKHFFAVTPISARQRYLFYQIFLEY